MTQGFDTVKTVNAIKKAQEAQKIKPIRALIEASAGTGKTYSLMQLVKRLIKRNITRVNRLLVVTFTNAAVSELKERMGKDLRAESEKLEGLLEKANIEGKQGASVLQDALQSVRQAVNDLDDACVYTIHGFCQRMLSDHAFTQGERFETSVVMDEEPYKDRVIDEFLRHHIHAHQGQPEGEATVAMLLDAKVSRGMHSIDEAIFRDWKQLLKWVLETPPGQPITWESQEEAHPLAPIYDAFIQWAPRRFEALKAQDNVISPNDQLKRMQQAVATNAEFVDRVRSLFDVVLVDEFQDTDRIQYDIFKTLFMAEDSPQKLVVFVGDPKQSIYRFRGADLDTYLRAKKDLDASEHFTLDTNWRATMPLVSCLNALYKVNATEAFLMKGNVEYEEVRSGQMAADSKTPVYGEDGKALPVVEILQQPESSDPKVTADQLRLREATWIATDIVTLLDGHHFIAGKPVQPKDIAILVQKRAHADGVRRLLSRAHIPVKIKSQDDVFQSEEAGDIADLLIAMEVPWDMKRLSAARATLLFGDTLSDFTGDKDDAQLRARMDIQEMRARFDRYGLMSAFRYVFEARDIEKKLLPTIQGARHLRNYLHVLELLQAKAVQLKTLAGLVRWFEKARERSSTDDARKERIESDENLITIDTIHGAKGLEYPIVYLAGATAKVDASKVSYERDAQGALTLFYEAKKTDQETLAEKQEAVRRAYVAMTRASSRLVIPLLQKTTKGGAHKCTSMNAYWITVTGSEDPSLGAWNSALEEMQCKVDASMPILKSQYALWGLQEPQTSSDVIAVRELDEAWEGKSISSPIQQGQEGETLGVDDAKDVFVSWRQSSFSSLARGIEIEVASDDEMPYPEEELQEVIDEDDVDILQVRGGTEIGTMLHALFENADFPKVCAMDEATLFDTVGRWLRPYQGALGDSESFVYAQKACTQMMRDVLTTVLPCGFSLESVTKDVRASEMKFLIPIETAIEGRQTLSGPLLNRTLEELSKAHQKDPGYALGTLNARELNGFLTGTIDLLFLKNNQYWIVDWKSNKVASRASGFTTKAMQEEMQAHHYRLQYLLYTVALYRMLKSRLDREHVSELIGGALYLFIRGIRPDGKPGQGGVFDRPHSAVIMCLDEFFSQGFSEDRLQYYVKSIREGNAR